MDTALIAYLLIFTSWACLGLGLTRATSIGVGDRRISIQQTALWGYSWIFAIGGFSILALHLSMDALALPT
jgi:hypothetical protein